MKTVRPQSLSAVNEEAQPMCMDPPQNRRIPFPFGNKKSLIIATLFILMLIPLVIEANKSTVIPASDDGWTDEEWANDLIETDDKGFAFAGVTSFYGTGQTDMWFIKTNEQGLILWNQTYGGSEDERANAIVQTADGGFALIGSTTSFGAGQMDIWLVKTDRMGFIEWTQTYGGTGDEEGLALLQTADGGFALAGFTAPFFPLVERDWWHLWLVKTDAKGEMQWNQSYDSIGNWLHNYYREKNNPRMPPPTSLIQTVDGGFALTGGNSLVKTDMSGMMEWNKSFYSGSSRISTLIQTSDNGFALGGMFGHIFYDGILIKTDGEGVVQWETNFIDGEYEAYKVLGIVQTTDNGFGVFSSGSFFHYNFAKLGADGSHLWNYSFDQAYVGPESELGEDNFIQQYKFPMMGETDNLILTSDGEIIMGGVNGKFGKEYGVWLVTIDEQSVAWRIPTHEIPTPTSSSTTDMGISGLFVVGITLGWLDKRKKRKEEGNSICPRVEN
ncbi:MAG: hypothetical protein ACE5OZ_15955 [Candidatus Heimdallarchaeota archaeon]